MIKVLPFWHTDFPPWKKVNTTSRAGTWSSGLSPFLLGPCLVATRPNNLQRVYVTSKNMENAWQYAKVYEEYADPDCNPTSDYWTWATKGWAKKQADRYPAGKGRKPLYSLWDGERLDYLNARVQIYCPLYAKAVEKTLAYQQLKNLYKKEGKLVLLDFDAYDHREMGMGYLDVLYNPDKKMGHAFVLAMMLQNKRLWE